MASALKFVVSDNLPESALGIIRRALSVGYDGATIQRLSDISPLLYPTLVNDIQVTGIVLVRADVADVEISSVLQGFGSSDKCLQYSSDDSLGSFLEGLIPGFTYTTPEPVSPAPSTPTTPTATPTAPTAPATPPTAPPPATYTSTPTFTQSAGISAGQYMPAPVQGQPQAPMYAQAGFEYPMSFSQPMYASVPAVNPAQSQLDAVQFSLSASQHRVKSLEADVADKEREIERLHADLASAQGRVELLEREKADRSLAPSPTGISQEDFDKVSNDLILAREEKIKFAGDLDSTRLDLASAQHKADSAEQSLTELTDYLASIMSPFEAPTPLEVSSDVSDNGNVLFMFSGSKKSTRDSYKSLVAFASKVVASDPDKIVNIVDISTDSLLDYYNETKFTSRLGSWLFSDWLRDAHRESDILELVSTFTPARNNPNIRLSSLSVSELFSDLSLLSVNWSEKLADVASLDGVNLVYGGDLSSSAGRALFVAVVRAGFKVRVDVPGTIDGLRPLLLFLSNSSVYSQLEGVEPFNVRVSGFVSAKMNLRMLESLKSVPFVKVEVV